MIVLPIYIRFLDRIHALINFEILWVYICLIIGLALIDLYKFVFKKIKRNKMMIFRVTIYIVLLVVIRLFYYLQFEKTFTLELDKSESITIDAKNDDGTVIAQDLQLEAEFIEILQSLMFTLAKKEKNSYSTSDELIELRIIPKEMSISNLYMVFDEDEVLIIYVVAGSSLTLQSDHKNLYDYLISE
jgi:hypothetical protein